jgi:hypothetical protein
MLDTLKRNWIPSAVVAAFIAWLAVMVWQSGSHRPKPTIEPSRSAEFVLDNMDSFSPGSGSQFILWDFHGYGVGTLNAKLIVAKNGVGKEATSITCDWKTPPQEFTGRMLLMMMDGEGFGKKDQQVPKLALEFRSGKPDQTGTRTRKDSEVLIQGPFGITSSTASLRPKQISANEPAVSYYSMMSQLDKSVGVNGHNVETLIESTKKGSTAVIVVVEWSVERKPEPKLDD